MKIIFLFLSLLLPLAHSAPALQYEKVRPTADGIGKTYMGREIAAIMGWQGAAWLERDEREQEERTDLLMRELALKPGMVVADIGAGSGYVTRRMAALVGAAGKVYAVDVQPQMIRMLQELAKRPGLGNIEPVLSAVDDVKLLEAMQAKGVKEPGVDLAIMVDVYHELEFPHEVISSVIGALKPGGRLLLVEYRAEDPKVPIKPVHKMTEAQARREMAAHSQLVWERTGQTLPWQHVVIFRRK